MRLLNRFLADRSASTAIEYALIIALIAVAIIASVQQVGYAISETFNNISNHLK